MRTPGRPLILTLNDFVKLAQDPEQMQRENAAHVWANSLVAGGKHRHVQRGPRFLDEALAVMVVVVAAVVGEFGG
jgi:hypothetical protein